MQDRRAPALALPLALPLVLGLCFFLSGAGSLMLEVVWSRLLRLVFGTTTLAISTILVAYMAGLGLGAYLGGRLAPRVRDGVRAYAWLELAVGAYALLVPGIFALFPGLGRAWLSGLPFWPAALVRFALSLAVLIVPTVGMGMTLPLLTREVVRDASWAGRGIGLLYGLNTLGAVFGVFVSTFAFLPWLGVRGSCFAGAGIDLAVGALALWSARSRAPAAAPLLASAAPAPAPGGALARWNPGLLAYGTVGFTSLVYEVTWTRALSMVMGSSIYAFSCMLAAFLLGIALGSLASARVADRVTRPLLAYAAGLTALGLLSFASFALLPHLPEAFMALVRRSGGSPLALLGAQIAMAVPVMLPPALVLGALFPLLSRAQTAISGAAPAVGDVYFVNTVGSALGAFAAGFVLLPLLGLRGTTALAIALNLAAAAAVLSWRGHTRAPVRAALAAAPALGALAIALAPPPFDPGLLAEGSFVAARIFETAADPSILEGMPSEELLYYRDGISASVSVHRLRGMISLHTNGKPDASTGPDMGTQVMLGEAGLLFGPPAKDALVIGFASGITVGSLARHPVERIDAV
ncbi:MAG TPA: fused MFS/spermidine synthase, partial [Myxococcota bacterium]|nr:fused MFS/spermidine synthase [Myxococcota bacterium]